MAVDVDEYLSVYLAEAGKAPGIGPERVKMPPKKNGRYDGIAKFVSPYGSYRYMRYVAGRPVAALQVVAHDKAHAIVANVYTAPSHRREGYAAELLRAARKDFDVVEHAHEDRLSAKGKAWRDRVR